MHLHKFVIGLTHKIHEKWFATNKMCFTVLTKLSLFINCSKTLERERECMINVINEIKYEKIIFVILYFVLYKWEHYTG
jgi:hypothetical protein